MGFIKKMFGGGGGGDSGPDQAAVDQAKKAQAEAQAQQTKIAEEQARYQAELNQMNKNYQADLSNDNRAMVETAGSANASADLMNADQKRRKPTTGLASTLGINV